MAAHFDLAARLEALGVAEELYSGDPPKLIKDIAAAVRAGRWPLALNVKGVAADDVLVIVSLAGFEAMTRGGNGR